MSKKWIIILSIIVVVGVVVGLVVYNKNKAPSYELIEVKRGTLTEEVSVTGSTRPVQSVDLSFERTGRVTRVNVDVGSKVTAGQVLVEIDRGDLLAQRISAVGNVEAEQARLDELRAGTRPESIALSETRVVNAAQAVADANASLLAALNDAYAKAEDAGRRQTDPLFTDPHTLNPTFTVMVFNQQFKNDAESGKINTEKTLTAWKTYVYALTTTDDLHEASATATGRITAVKTFLDLLVAALNNALPTQSVSTTTIDTWKSSLATARASVNTALSAITASDSAVRAAESALTVAQNQLALDKAGATVQAIAAQSARVKQAQSSLANLDVSIGKTILRTPINGVVVAQGAKLGQIVTVSSAAATNGALVSIISDGNLEIEANVPEVDIGRVKAGDRVGITFDALSGKSFNGTVAMVDPAETIIGGVVNYKITVAFSEPPVEVKSGLTANLAIKTAIKENVLIVPQYAIVENDNGTFVRVLDKNTPTDKPVTVGVRDQSGMVEIVSGVNEGEHVLNIGLKTER